MAVALEFRPSVEHRECIRSLSLKSKPGRETHLADGVGPREGAEELQPRGVLPGRQHHLLHLHNMCIADGAPAKEPKYRVRPCQRTASGGKAYSARRQD